MWYLWYPLHIFWVVYKQTINALSKLINKLLQHNVPNQKHVASTLFCRVKNLIFKLHISMYGIGPADNIRGVFMFPHDLLKRGT